MNIEKIWGEMNDRQDDDLSLLLQTKKLAELSSRNPLEKIRKSLLINIIWGILVCSLYIWVIFYFHIWQVQVTIGLVLIFSLWAVYTAYVQYKNISTAVSSGRSLLAEMKTSLESISNWMKTQQRVALLIYPVSAAGGFMLGGVLGSGKPVALFMTNSTSVIALLVSIAILVPACYWLARWMFNYSFGKHLKKLKENIKELEAEK